VPAPVNTADPDPPRYIDPVATAAAAATFFAITPTIQTEQATAYARLPTQTPQQVNAAARGTCPVSTPASLPDSVLPDNLKGRDKPEIMAAKSYRTWCYLVYTDYMYPPQLVDISFDGSTVQSLNAFAQENKELAGELSRASGSVEVPIWFRAPIKLDDFRQWARGHNLQATLSQLQVAPGWQFYVDDRVAQGVASTPDNPLILPDNFRDDMFQGVYMTRARLEASQLPEIISDPQVFMVNVTSIVVRRDLGMSWTSIRNGDLRPKDIRDGNLYPNDEWGAPIFQYMQALGLENFQN
jgi:hypothetical protein